MNILLYSFLIGIQYIEPFLFKSIILCPVKSYTAHFWTYKKDKLIIKTVSRRYLQTSNEDADKRLVCIFMAISFLLQPNYVIFLLHFVSFLNIIWKTHFFNLFTSIFIYNPNNCSNKHNRIKKTLTSDSLCKKLSFFLFSIEQP